jgi:hypothetical protein
MFLPRNALDRVEAGLLIVYVRENTSSAEEKQPVLNQNDGGGGLPLVKSSSLEYITGIILGSDTDTWFGAMRTSGPYFPMQVNGGEVSMASMDNVQSPRLRVGCKCWPWYLRQPWLKFVPKKIEHDQGKDYGDGVSLKYAPTLAP